MASTNTLFAVFAASQPEKLSLRLADSALGSLPLLSRQTSDDSWLIIAPKAVTTQELSNSLGITDASSSGAIVVRVENYFGRASTDIWEWITAKMEVTLDASTNQTSR